MGLRPDPKCQHNKTRGACSACKKGKAPMSGTMRNGRLVTKRSRNDNKPRGDNKRLGRHNGWG